MRYEEPRMDIMEIELDGIITQLSQESDFNPEKETTEDGSWI